jgi:hypothetical protein
MLPHGRGLEVAAVGMIQYIALKSKRPYTLTVKMLHDNDNDRFGRDSQITPVRPPFKEPLLAQFKMLSMRNLKPLCGKPKLTLQTGLTL